MRFAIGMQALEQAAVEAEVGAQHLGDGEGEMPVGNRVEDGPAQKLAEELDLPRHASRPGCKHFWWQEGQNQRPLQEKARMYSCRQ